MAPPSEREPLLQKAVDTALSDPTKLPTRTRNLILGSMWIGVFLGALDGTVVATLVTDISSTFKASNQSSWLGTAFLLSTAVFTPLYGRLADIIGRRNSSLLALSLFTLGTLLCGMAPSMNALIAARLVAGMGGGGMMTISSIIASDLVPLKKRGFYQGLANICFGAGAGLGAPVGGLISDQIGWRWAFFAQVPILMTALGCVFAFVKYTVPGQGKTKREMLGRIDYMGSLFLVLSIGSLLLSLSFKNNEGLAWSSPLVYGTLITFAVFLVCFLTAESKWAKEPVMPLRIVTARNGFFVNTANFFMSMVSFSLLYFYPMWFEAVKLDTASRAGAHLLPNSIALSVGSLFAGWMIRKTGKFYWLNVFSSMFPVAACIGIAFLDEDAGWFHSWLGIVPAGFGFSSVVTTCLIALIASVDRTDMAAATGTSYLARYVGQVVGVALSASVQQGVLSTQLHKRITGPGSEKIIEQIRHVSTSVRSLPPDLQRSAIRSYVHALRAVFIFNAGLAFLCFLCTLGLREYPLPGSFEEEEEERSRRQSRAQSGLNSPA